MSFGKDVLIRKTSNNFVWLEIDKRFITNLQKNFYIVAVYINDITSTYYDDNIFQELHTDILEFGSGGTPILFMGDFNGRTGTLDDIYRESLTKSKILFLYQLVFLMCLKEVTVMK